MTKIIIACLMLLAGTRLCAATPYWQQKVKYDIRVTLDDAAHTLKGFEKMIYSNRSPDTLRYIYIHCWPNAYKDNTTALYQQLSRLEERKTKLQRVHDNGYIDNLDFTVDGTKAQTETDAQNPDIMKLQLPSALAPGQEITIATPFLVKIPSYFSRMGHEGKSYMITQWFPKPAVYDSRGWHPMPYLDQGEFYSEFGSFDVHITVPASYVVGATGQLGTIPELESYKKLGMLNRSNPSQPRHYKAPAVSPNRLAPAAKTLDYHADSVHDFAWFADKSFIVQYDTLRLASGRVIDIFAYYRAGGNRQWSKSISFIKDAVNHYSRWIGEYAWPVVSAVEGPGNTSSGGMEYPMITLITSPKAPKEELDGVIAHEVGHNWFYGMLASNERDHPWMDEGVNTFYEFRYEGEKYRYNGILGDMIPERIKKFDEDQFLSAVYNVINQLRTVEPIESPATSFRSEFDYGLVVYAKTAVWMHLLETELGKDVLEKGMLAYFADWKFKHPYPEDMEASLEEATGHDLHKIFALLNKQGSL